MESEKKPEEPTASKARSKNPLDGLVALEIEGLDRKTVEARTEAVMEALEKAGLEPDAYTIVAMFMAAAKNGEALKAHIRNLGPDGDIRPSALGARLLGKRESGNTHNHDALQDILNNPPTRGAVRKGADGQPQFMAPMPKMVQ